MKRHDFVWSSNNYHHPEQAVESTAHLTIKALGVIYKHCLIPMAEYNLDEWSRYDHYREDLNVIEESDDDKVWVKPWLIGQWMGGEECILQLEPGELLEEVYKEKEWAELGDWKHRHERGVILGLYFTVTRKSENWSAVFALRVDDKMGANKVHDLPVREAFCLSIDGDVKKAEKWLDEAYKKSA
ncbi:MAG: hypothetical protein L3J28_14725 [Candidatus Polarisedimenticolaceae bacterium]|nr:hypothetical protein [Candidatus Polarisedimenticolaceae bacterium]